MRGEEEEEEGGVVRGAEVGLVVEVEETETLVVLYSAYHLIIHTVSVCKVCQVNLPNYLSLST